MCLFTLIHHSVNHDNLDAALEEFEQSLKQEQGPPIAGGEQLRKCITHITCNVATKCGRNISWASS